MPRKFISPQVHRSIVKKGILIGKGQRPGRPSTVYRAELVESNGTRFVAAAKKIKPNALLEKAERKIALQGQLAWRAFKRAGLPVPSFSRMDLRKKSNAYLTNYMEDVSLKHRKLFDGHEKGIPVFLKRFSFQKDKNIIMDLAKDLATIHNLGFATHHLDFWHFYQSGNTYGRVILDFHDFFKVNNKVYSKDTHDIFYSNYFYLNQVLEPRAFDLFIKTYLTNMRPNNPGYFASEYLKRLQEIKSE